MKRGNQSKAAQSVAALALTGLLSMGAEPLFAQSSLSGPDFGAGVQSLGNVQAGLADIHDSNNRKVGEVQHLFVNPLSGAIEQVGIQFDLDPTDRTRLFLVPWNQFTVTRRNNGALALILDQASIDRLRLTGSTTSTGTAPFGGPLTNGNVQSGGANSGSNQPGSTFGR